MYGWRAENKNMNLLYFWLLKKVIPILQQQRCALVWSGFMCSVMTAGLMMPSEFSPYTSVMKETALKLLTKCPDHHMHPLLFALWWFELYCIFTDDEMQGFHFLTTPLYVHAVGTTCLFVCKFSEIETKSNLWFVQEDIDNLYPRNAQRFS